MALAWGAATTVNQPLRLTPDQFFSKVSNPDGGPLALTVTATSNTLGFVSMKSTNVTYVPPLNYAGTDSFAYVVTDDWGATASAEVQILVVTGSLPTPQQLLITATTSGFQLRFAGEAGGTYRIERSPDLALPWTALDTISVPLYGLLEYEDRNPPPGAAFYQMAPP